MQQISLANSAVKSLILFIGCICALFLFLANSNAQSVANKEEIGKIVREYLLENPEILIEVQEALQQKQQAELAITQQRTIQENREAIFSSPHQIVFGNPDASKTIVEFFDYNCGFCQRALADMQEFIDNDEDVKFVLKEFPVLGEASLDASRVSLAFAKLKPESYPEFHIELLGMDGLKDRNRALNLAESMGADREKLELEMESPEIFQAIQEVYEIANGLGITGTPSYIAGNEVVFGAVGYTELKQALESQTN